MNWHEMFAVQNMNKKMIFFSVYSLLFLGYTASRNILSVSKRELLQLLRLVFISSEPESKLHYKRSLF